MKPPRLLLAPYPRHVRNTGGALPLARVREIVAPPPESAEMRRIATLTREALGPSVARSAIRFDGASRRPRLTARPSTADAVCLLVLDPKASRSDQGYRLDITPRGIVLTAPSAAGLFYGIQTLSQLVRLNHRRLPGISIRDEPDFPTRGVMLDISRDKVPTMQTLYHIVDWLASLKINQLQLYTEHTFAYRRHRTVWKDASPMTPAEIRDIDKYCRDRFIELVPNQNCFGHMERWLRHARYRPLAEVDGPWRDPWGRVRETPSTLNPRDPRSFRLVSALLDELLPNFTSRRVNVGCDETFELGQGRSRTAVSRRGRVAVYLDFVRKIHRHVSRLGRRMQMWADIVQSDACHISRIPDDVIALEWGYEADHDFESRCNNLSARGLEYYVCPGTSSWCSFGGRTRNAMANLQRAARAGLEHGATGYLITDWGDGGHRQYWSASVVPITYGAAVAWNERANRGLDAGRAASTFGFDDPSGLLGRLWYELGNVYLLTGVSMKNRTQLYKVIETDLDPLIELHDDAPQPRGAEEAIAVLHELARLSQESCSVRAGNCEAQVALIELQATIKVMLHAAERWLFSCSGDLEAAARRRALHCLGDGMNFIMQTHETLWRIRNRPGGMRDSLARYRRIADEYLEFLKRGGVAGRPAR